MNCLLRRLRINLGIPKRKWLDDHFGGREFKLLDVGSGNDSARQIKSVLPECRFFGLDLDRSYQNSEDSFRLMEAFYELNLDSLDYQMIPDAYFDAILMVHVIEHLKHPLESIEQLCRKLKPTGSIYIEWPHERSRTFPSMRDSLNFHDDPSHISIPDAKNVEQILAKNGFVDIERGTRRNWWYLAFSPLLIPKRALQRGYLSGPDFWDFLGFAQFVSGQRR